MRIAKSVAELIGRTPMLELTHFEQMHCLNAHLLAKVESFNPGGSVKDRIALGMVEAAEKAGKLLPGGTIIEPTSGNTGIGLAMVAAARGYTAIIVMPDSMSVERRQLMLAYGAKLVLTPGKLGMKGAVDKANELAAETPNAIVVGQFVNPANPATHRATTGPEIWADTDGQVDVPVA
ncbi:MAG: pyridoxal-phosphate dependent enzyme, partial [Clostridia bacterium]|nr:pyridoxal-phosphate dependent enzyme [Clostridia bacterium]